MKVLRWLTRWARLLPHLLRETLTKAWADRVLGLSAEAAFWQLLSLPSLLLALVATLGYASDWFGTSRKAIEDQIERTLGTVFTRPVVQNIIGNTLNQVLNSGRADIVSLGFVLALWAGSSATATFVNTITIAYGMRDLRGAVHSRLLALGLFLGSVVIGVVVLPLLVLGPNLVKRAMPPGARPTLNGVIDAGYYPTVVFLLLIGLSTLYHLAPPRRLPWFRGIPGAVLAILVFLGGSLALRAYISFVVANNSVAYGTIAAPIAALLFFFVLAIGVLLGAEFNAAIERERPSVPRKPRVLNPKDWEHYAPDEDEPVNRDPSAKAPTETDGNQDLAS